MAALLIHAKAVHALWEQPIKKLKKPIFFCEKISEEISCVKQVKQEIFTNILLG